MMMMAVVGYIANLFLFIKGDENRSLQGASGQHAFQSDFQ